MDSSQQRLAVVCLSGGLDSTSLLLHLLSRNRKVFALSFDYGQKHKIELQRLKANLKYLSDHDLNVQWQLINLSDLAAVLHSALINPDWEVPAGHYESENMKQTVVPNRNAIFASIAFAHALSLSQKSNAAVEICLGVHAGDHTIYPDCRPEFYEAIFHAFRIGNWDSEWLSMHLPYLEFDKHQILKDAQQSAAHLGLDFQTIFGNTLTSYAPDDQGCSAGLTGSDVERILAFDKLGIPDPIDYHSDWSTVVARARQLEAEFESTKE